MFLTSVQTIKTINIYATYKITLERKTKSKSFKASKYVHYVSIRRQVIIVNYVFITRRRTIYIIYNDIIL